MRRRLSPILATALLTTVLSSFLVLGGATAAFAVDIDTCTAVPDSGKTFDFTEACGDHDACYGEKPHGTGAAARKQCDVDFYHDMVDSCNADWPRRSQWFKRGACKGVAGLYYVGVRALGAIAWLDGGPAPLAEAA